MDKIRGKAVIMISKHLNGKCAEEIVNKMKSRFNSQRESYDDDEYIIELEKLLLLAVKDALYNADGKNICDGDYSLMGSEAECRAITFLNTILSKE